MISAPKRPIRFVFKLGKGNVKARRESENPTRAVVEQMMIEYAGNWGTAKEPGAKQDLQNAIAQDVRAELAHTAGLFRRYVIGAPGNQRGLVGKLDTVSKGGTPPTQNLGSLPRWAPRTARYLDEKFVLAGHDDWFDNSNWTNRDKGGRNGGRKLVESGHLREFFQSETDLEGGTNMHIGSGGILEDIFGGISVKINRNNVAGGVNAGMIKLNPAGTKGEVQIATVEVRALGAVTEAMMRISDSSNIALLDEIGKTDKIAALHLRGGRGRYRPTLEPYLRFFLERALPHAVQQRIARGVATGRLLARRS